MRVLLGIGKLAGAIVLLLPRLPTLKEWAPQALLSCGSQHPWLHYLAGDGALFLLPMRVDRLAGGFVSHAAGGSPRVGAGDAAGQGEVETDCTRPEHSEVFASGEGVVVELPLRAWPYKQRESDPESAPPEGWRRDRIFVTLCASAMVVEARLMAPRRMRRRERLSTPR